MTFARELPRRASCFAIASAMIAGTALADTLSPQEVAAAIAVDRAAIGSCAVHATIDWSTGTRAEVLVAWQGDRAPWRELERSDDGVDDSREAIVNAEVGVGWSVIDAATVDPNSERHALVGSRSATVRAEQEAVGNQLCWVIDINHPQGYLDRTIWIAPARNRSPARSILWSPKGEVVREHVVEEWMALSPDRWVPSVGTTALPGRGHDATRAIIPTAELPGGATLVPSEALLPADPRSVVPDGSRFSPLDATVVTAPATEPIAAPRGGSVLAASRARSVAEWVLGVAASAVRRSYPAVRAR